MKNTNVKEQLDSIADFIRDAYSVHGVEVGAQGARSVSVRLPEDLPLTELCADLWNTFEAPVDLKPGPILTVYASESPDANKTYEKLKNQDDDEDNDTVDACTVSSTLWWLFIKIVVWITSFCAASYAKPFVQDTALYTWTSNYLSGSTVIAANKSDL